MMQIGLIILLVIFLKFTLLCYAFHNIQLQKKCNDMCMFSKYLPTIHAGLHIILSKI